MTLRGYWAKPLAILLVMIVLMRFSPEKAIDPWNLFSPKKIATMIFALSLIQAFGSILPHYLGMRMGSILTGFLGGLVSSTATTAGLARRSRTAAKSHVAAEMLIFLSATTAMLFEGLVLLIAGSSEVQLPTLMIFVGPMVATLGMMFWQGKALKGQKESLKPSEFHLLPVLKLSLFILAVLAVSKVFQSFFGESGLLLLTALVSLFEIHGSIIANVQLAESHAVTSVFLCSLLGVSIGSSYLSKLFLISTIGSRALLIHAMKSTFFLFGALVLSWTLAVWTSGL